MDFPHYARQLESTRPENSVLEDVTRLRNQTMGDESIADKQRDENTLPPSLNTLFAVIRNYPDWKASSHFVDLQQQLVAIEDDTPHAARYFNGTVRHYNTGVQMFPSHLVPEYLDSARRSSSSWQIWRTANRQEWKLTPTARTNQATE